MKITGLVPMLSVTDLSRTIAFYRDLLGFRVVSTYDHQGRTTWAALERDGVEIMFNQAPGAWVESRDRSARDFQVYYFGVDDVRALHAALTARGLACSPLRTTDYQMQEFELRDPDHYWLWFGEPAPQDADP